MTAAGAHPGEELLGCFGPVSCCLGRLTVGPVVLRRSPRETQTAPAWEEDSETATPALEDTETARETERREEGGCQQDLERRSMASYADYEGRPQVGTAGSEEDEVHERARKQQKTCHEHQLAMVTTIAGR